MAEQDDNETGIILGLVAMFGRVIYGLFYSAGKGAATTNCLFCRVPLLIRAAFAIILFSLLSTIGRNVIAEPFCQCSDE